MEPNVYTVPTPWYKRKLVWGFVLLLILIPTGSYLYASYFRKPSPPPPPAPAADTIKEEDLPIALDILQNPLVYEWRGLVEGTLTAKDEKSITLTDDKGNKIIITVQSSSKEITGTKFYKTEPIPDKDGRRFTEITVDKIPLGTRLNGDFFVFLHKKNELVGSSFNLVEK